MGNLKEVKEWLIEAKRILDEIEAENTIFDEIDRKRLLSSEDKNNDAPT